ncbi:histidine decarboxylase [Nitzschia inconspicua]|uniref:Histidine decarboxylase n=1 Tax=Nitzschia inconspicua TaxID=303405 RepID=A0A9K3PVY2_9STRA|nr:histidine decarboxylase [Nitzschia inconspicua]
MPIMSFSWQRLFQEPFGTLTVPVVKRGHSTLAPSNDSDSEDEEEILQAQKDVVNLQRLNTPLQHHQQQFFKNHPIDPTPPSSNSILDDLTFSRQKAGTPSPWAVFDAWGAGNEITANELLHHTLSHDDQVKLTEQAVKIPMVEKERHTVPAESDILHAYDKFLQQRSTVHLGYPYNLMYDHQELFSFMKYSINNLGDPYVAGNYGVHSRQFECAVIDFFARLWKMEPDSYWGYVTTSGTEGNLHGILLARECHPDGILYTSQETHYSVFKAARYYRMDLRSIPTLPMGEINYDLLAQELDRNRDYPAIINVNIGTTVKGAVDNLDRILEILTALDIPRERYHIHCDGALFALMMPFIDNAPEISFQKPIDSMAVSGHKMLGCPMPCGVALSRKEHVEKVEQHIDYLNTNDTTIMGSRNGQAALYMWYSLRKKGIPGIKRDVMHCIETARYLRNKLSRVGISCRLNDLSSTVVLERPLDDVFIRRWQLACEEDIAHVVVMPNVTTGKIDLFVQELVESAKKNGRIRPIHPQSQLAKLETDSWGGEGSSL